MLVRVCAEEELSAEDKSVYTVLVQNAEATPLDVGYQWLSSRLRQTITLPMTDAFVGLEPLDVGDIIWRHEGARRLSMASGLSRFSESSNTVRSMVLVALTLMIDLRAGSMRRERLYFGHLGR